MILQSIKRQRPRDYRKSNSWIFTNSIKSVFDFREDKFYKAFLKKYTPLSLLNTVSNELAKFRKNKMLSISEFNAIIHREIQNQPAPLYMND
jgi:hypothetical protein